jgi:luciferase-like monooxygenase
MVSRVEADDHDGMTETRSASQQIVDEVTSWPDVTAVPGSRGELSLRAGRREIGHLHGDRVAHFGFPKKVGAELRAQGRIEPHPVFPDKLAWGARRIAGEDDVREVIELMRLNYDRAASA